jgi:hypothetical protein
MGRSKKPRYTVIRKRCTHCETTKDGDQFSNSKTSVDGKRNFCNACRNELRKGQPSYLLMHVPGRKPWGRVNESRAETQLTLEVLERASRQVEFMIDRIEYRYGPDR